ncbi:MAG: flagellar hook protein [Lachnospiraceae bacterium]|nr:flagellar hook protein [Lachnospiraceae bacterium]
MVVQHNLTAMNANRMLGVTTGAQAKSTEKLSSGYKINRAADDAAGLSISEKMRRQIRGLTQASANAQDGISAVQTAEGALTEVHDMLQRMNELAVKAGNGTESESDREAIQNEIDQLVTEIDRVSETTKFNETYLLKGTGDKSKYVKGEATLGAAGSEVTQNATQVAAHGNQYTAKIKSGLGSGTEDTATVKYLDADGNTRTKDVTFKVGSDNENTVKNLADAIAEDDDLSKIFEVSTSGSEITVESKLTGDKTDSKANFVQAITFATGTGATLKTEIDGTATTNKAEGSAVSFKLTDGAGASLLTDGNTITVDGKTFTYNATNTAADGRNTFGSVDDLQKLLGDDYEVSLVATGKKVSTTYGAQNTDPTTVKEEEVSTKLASTTALNSTAATAATAAGYTPATAPAFSANATVVHYPASDVAVSLQIARKANVDVEDTLSFSLQVGADTTEENKITVDIDSMSAKGLGIDGLKVTGKDSTNADAAVNTITDAISKVSAQRSALGAVQNRLEHTIKNLDNVVENTTSAESAIRDTDMATEMVQFSKNNILAQAGQSMLAQANQSNQGVLSLLG